MITSQAITRREDPEGFRELLQQALPQLSGLDLSNIANIAVRRVFYAGVPEQREEWLSLAELCWTAAQRLGGRWLDEVEGARAQAYSHLLSRQDLSDQRAALVWPELLRWVAAGLADFEEMPVEQAWQLTQGNEAEVDAAIRFFRRRNRATRAARLLLRTSTNSDYSTFVPQELHARATEIVEQHRPGLPPLPASEGLSPTHSRLNAGDNSEDLPPGRSWT